MSTSSADHRSVLKPSPFGPVFCTSLLSSYIFYITALVPKAILRGAETKPHHPKLLQTLTSMAGTMAGCAFGCMWRWGRFGSWRHSQVGQMLLSCGTAAGVAAARLWLRQVRRPLHNNFGPARTPKAHVNVLLHVADGFALSGLPAEGVP